MAETTAKQAPKKEKMYKLRSQNKFLYVATRFGNVQFVNGEYETANVDLYRELLRYNDIVAV